jgi:hypothetical protein
MFLENCVPFIEPIECPYEITFQAGILIRYDECIPCILISMNSSEIKPDNFILPNIFICKRLTQTQYFTFYRCEQNLCLAPDPVPQPKGQQSTRRMDYYKYSRNYAIRKKTGQSMGQTGRIKGAELLSHRRMRIGATLPVARTEDLLLVASGGGSKRRKSPFYDAWPIYGKSSVAAEKTMHNSEIGASPSCSSNNNDYIYYYGQENVEYKVYDPDDHNQQRVF